MSKKFSGSASSLVTKSYGSKSTISTEDARQGRYETHSYLCVGIIRFSTLTKIDWSTKVIKNISLTLTHGSSGRYNGTNKTFRFWPSNYQVSNDTSVKGSAFISGQAALGSVAKACKRNTDVSISLPADNQALFDNLVTYLKSGSVNTICIYINESLSGEYTANYLQVTAASITIEYEDAVVYFGVDGEWVPCLVYYGQNDVWEQTIPYYGNGESWTQV